MKTIIVIAAALIATSASAQHRFGSRSEPLIERDLAGVAKYVYDGDQVRLRKERLTFRLMGLNAPEMKSICQNPEAKAVEQRAAVKARDRLRQLVNHPTARLSEVLCHGSNFGRRCGIVKVEGIDVATIMIRENLAEPFTCGSKGCTRRRDWCQTAITPQ